MAKKVKLVTCSPFSDDWEAQDALRTLCRAKEIEKNKPLMEKVKALAQKQLEQSAQIIAEGSDD